ncbi:MAG: hypothetical protein ABJA02_05395 [Acidobacteriota bacterium]
MKFISVIGLVFSAVLVFSIAVPAQSNETFIQGKWRLDGHLPPNQSGHSMSWYQEWTFADGTFIEEGYPPLNQKGRFRIFKDENNKLTLELYEQSGDLGSKDSKLIIIINKEHDTLKVGQNPGFKRTKPKT